MSKTLQAAKLSSLKDKIEWEEQEKELEVEKAEKATLKAKQKEDGKKKTK